MLYKVIIFTTGFCGVLYELALAQLSVSYIGGTSLRYALCLGLFMLFMGLGSLAVEKFSTKKTKVLLYWIELLLFILGTSSSFVLLAVSLYANNFFELVFYTFVVTIGFISGMELPLLKLLDNKLESLLFYDYLGMFAATLFFSTFLFSRFGILSAIFVAAWFNLLALVLISRIFNFYKVASSIVFTIFSLALFFALYQSDWILKFYSGLYVS